MNDKDLDALKSMKTLDPSEEAKARAVAAALTAFDASATEKSTLLKKITKGISSPFRFITVFLEMTGELIMRRRMLVGTAAVLVIAAPVALVLYGDELGGNAKNKDGKPVTEKKVVTRDITNKPKKPTDPNQTTNGLAKKSATESKKLQTKLPSKKTGDVAKKRETFVIIEQTTSGGNQQKKVVIENKDSSTEEDAIMVGARINLDRREKKKQPAVAFRLKGKSSSNLDGFARVPRVKYRKRGDARSLVFDDATLIAVEREQRNRDRFSQVENNPVKSVKQNPVSTFSIDVDTSSYAFMRRTINQGNVPRKDSIRVEELINYFTYDYELPDSAEAPFKANVAVYQTPWNKDTKLLHIGIKGHDIVQTKKPRSNLVFLIDVSGSMSSADKLPLLRKAFMLLVDQLGPDDTVAIVTYAGRAATVLKPTKVSEKNKILYALANLQSGGSTAGAQGIQKAYGLAKANYDSEGVNRVILATDGDFNVGITDRKELKRYIETQRKSGIFLSVLGFGRGNYNDALMQTLAQNGNGVAAYIDTLKEAHKVLVKEAGSTLFTIAKDVKIQIEFNPNVVAEYRLIGYETRRLKREDFNNDKVDAGDIGSGHTVTAIYEITPVGSPAQRVDDLRYAGNKKPKQASDKPGNTNEFAFLKLRYKLPKETKSKLITIPVTKAVEKNLEELSQDIRFAASVAAFGQKLRGSKYLEEFTYDDVHKLALSGRGKDPYGYRSEFLNLVQLIKSLDKSK